MKVSVDDKSTLSAEPSSISGIVDHVRSELPSDRIIAEILIDGRPLYLSGGSKASVAETHELIIRTANRQTWAVGGIELCLSNITEIQKSMLKVAESFREGKESQRCFLRCLDGLDRFLENVSITKRAFNRDLSVVEVDGVTLDALESELRKNLQRILEAQRKKDFSELSDQIEIGLLTHFQRWKSWLNWVNENHRSDD